MAYVNKLKKLVTDKTYTLGQTLRQAYTHFEERTTKEAKAL